MVDMVQGCGFGSLREKRLGFGVSGLGFGVRDLGFTVFGVCDFRLRGFRSLGFKGLEA